MSDTGGVGREPDALRSSGSSDKNTVSESGGAVNDRAEMTRFGPKVRHLRERAGLSQTELAALLGMSERSKGYISEIEHGKRIPTAEIILAMARYFNVATDALMRDEHDMSM